jgi:hypothetical protein
VLRSPGRDTLRLALVKTLVGSPERGGHDDGVLLRLRLLIFVDVIDHVARPTTVEGCEGAMRVRLRSVASDLGGVGFDIMRFIGDFEENVVQIIDRIEEPARRVSCR